MLIRENISLLPFNTFGLSAKAKIFAEYSSVEELRALLEQYKGEPLLHIGAGSNLLFTKDFDGVILHSAMRRARCVSEDADYVWIEAENGLVLDELIAQLCDMGISGLENLSYIPGEVGASAVQLSPYGLFPSPMERSGSSPMPNVSTATATVFSRTPSAENIS